MLEISLNANIPLDSSWRFLSYWSCHENWCFYTYYDLSMQNHGEKRFLLPFCNDGRNFNLGPVGLIWVDMVSLQILSLWKMCSGSWLSDWLDLLLLLCEQKKKKGIEWFSIADSKYSTLCNDVYGMNLVLSFWNTHYFQITKVIVVGHHL